MGPPDLIGFVELDADAMFAMASSIPATTDGGLGTEDGYAAAAWLELAPNTINATKPKKSSSGLVTGRNPFDSLGEIAVAFKARLPLPASLEEYGRSTGQQLGTRVSRGVADAGVRVSV